LDLPPNTQLIPPNDFEGMSYTLTMKFETLTELRNCKDQIDLIADNDMTGKYLI